MSDPIRRREDEDAEREMRVSRQNEPPAHPTPGGPEGGEESPAVDAHPLTPVDDQSPVGDTDQHTDSDNLPPHRDRENRNRS